MENYAGAVAERSLDVEVLLAHAEPRTTAAAHLAGVAVECRLKELIVIYHSLVEWGDPSNCRKDTRFGNPISRPGHSLTASIRLMDSLYKKAKADPRFIQHLSVVNNPTGANAVDFIGLRYSANSLPSASFIVWKKSYEYVLGWLRKNEKVGP